jgi:serine/threonine protein kinase
MDVIHRDLKPDNILLGENFRPFLADFGLSRVAKHMSEDEDDCDLEMTARIGTPLMMAPELLVNDATTEYTSKVDVYAWAVTVHMAMLQSPAELVFSDRSPLGARAPQFMQRIMQGTRFARPRVVPNNWWEIIQCCWAHRPEERPDFVKVCQEIGKPEYALEPAKADEYMDYVRELGPPGVEAGADAKREKPAGAPAAAAGKKFAFVRKR